MYFSKKIYREENQDTFFLGFRVAFLGDVNFIGM